MVLHQSLSIFLLKLSIQSNYTSDLQFHHAISIFSNFVQLNIYLASFNSFKVKQKHSGNTNKPLTKDNKKKQKANKSGGCLITQFHTKN